MNRIAMSAALGSTPEQSNHDSKASADHSCLGSTRLLRYFSALFDQLMRKKQRTVRHKYRAYV